MSDDELLSTLLILSLSRWVSCLPGWDFSRAFLSDLGVIRFIARGGHVIRNYLKKA